MKKVFNEKLKEIVDNSNDRSDYFTSERYNQIIFEVREAKLLKDTKNPLSSKQYRRLKRFDIITVGENDKLIEKTGKTPTETFRYYCKTEDLFDILETAHIATGHKRIRVMEAEINKKYCNVTRTAIQIYLSLCEQCQGKKKIKTKGLVVAPILSNHMNSRCQVDLIDMQSEPDRDYRFIFNYQDHLTKFKLPPAEVGQNVVVKVPDVDRGRLAPRNVLAAVLSVNECGLYKLGTKNGELERLYSRNEFTFADSNFIKLSEVPSTLLNLRQASVLASGSKQGFVMCNCKRYCISKKCNCRSKEVLCNSKCHNNSECKNK